MTDTGCLRVGQQAPDFTATAVVDQEFKEVKAFTPTGSALRDALRLAPGTPCPVASTPEQNMSLRDWRASTLEGHPLLIR